MSHKIIQSKIDNINIEYKANIIPWEKANKYLHILEKNLIYKSAEESVVEVNGTIYQIKRKYVLYGDLKKEECGDIKSWNNSSKQECVVIKNIKYFIEKYTGKKFNFVVINRYNDGSEKIGAHRDREMDLEDDPTIVGVSLGAIRSVVFAPYYFIPQETNKRIVWELGHGSMFIIKPPTNTFWTHEIPKRMKIKSVRISLTFRCISDIDNCDEYIEEKVE